MEQNYHEQKLFVPGKNGRSSYIVNPDYIPGCERTRLIQRMKYPQGSSRGDLAFGGGLIRGGLSEKAWELLKDICAFDYMGASEFEMGALPNAFREISKANDLEAYTLDVTGSPEFPFYGNTVRMYGFDALTAVKKAHVLTATVFVIAPKKIRPHVDLTIRRIARGNEDFLKEPSNLRDTLFCSSRWVDDEDYWARHATQGWVELDNGYLFFASEDMWRNFCNLFLEEQPSFDIKVAQPDFAPIDKALESCEKQT